MKNCAIIINGYYINEAIEHQVKSIREELELLGVQTKIVKGNELSCHIANEGIVNSLGKIDFAVFLDKDMHLAKMLEKSGVRLFNSAPSIEVCDDKALTYIALSGKVKMPKTITSPLMYRSVSSSDFVEKIEKILPYPVVVKKSFGSMGAGVYLAKNKDELFELREELKTEPHLYQEFIGRGGEDKRVILIGGKVVACMQRKNENDFRSNIECGGYGRATTLLEEEKQMAETVAKELNLDYCGVDILQGDGGVYFCEANSNAFFRGLESATGVKVGKIYAKYIFDKVYGSH